MLMRRVGILGGMGPQATVLLLQRLIAAVPAREDADHIPLIVDQNPQVPSRIGHLLERAAEDPGPVLADMARRLVANGAEALAMPCNTAHHYADAIRGAVAVPLLDILTLSAARAAALVGRGGKIGILASPAVRRIGLFDAAFARHGLTGVYAGDEGALLDAIRQIKAEGAQPGARAALRAASADLCCRGLAVQMIACTEFSLIADAVAPGVTAFDTLDLLVQAIKNFAQGSAKEDQSVA